MLLKKLFCGALAFAFAGGFLTACDRKAVAPTSGKASAAEKNAPAKDSDADQDRSAERKLRSNFARANEAFVDIIDTVNSMKIPGLKLRFAPETYDFAPARYAADLEKLRAAVGKSGEELEQFRSALEEKRRTLDDLRAENRRQANTIAENGKRLAKAERELAEERSKRQSAEKRDAENLKNAAALKARLTGAEKRERRSRVDAETAQKRLKAAEAELGQTRRNLEKEQAESARLKAENLKQQQNIRKMAEQAKLHDDCFARDRKKLDAKIKELEEKLRTLTNLENGEVASIEPIKDGSPEARALVVGEIKTINDKYSYATVDLSTKTRVKHKIGEKEYEVDPQIKVGQTFVVLRGDLNGPEQPKLITRVTIAVIDENNAVINIPGSDILAIQVGDLVIDAARFEAMRKKR